MGQTVVGLATAGLKGRAGPERVGCLTRRPTRVRCEPQKGFPHSMFHSHLLNISLLFSKPLAAEYRRRRLPSPVPTNRDYHHEALNALSLFLGSRFRRGHPISVRMAPKLSAPPSSPPSRRHSGGPRPPLGSLRLPLPLYRLGISEWWLSLRENGSKASIYPPPIYVLRRRIIPILRYVVPLVSIYILTVRIRRWRLRPPATPRPTMGLSMAVLRVPQGAAEACERGSPGCWQRCAGKGPSVVAIHVKLGPWGNTSEFYIGPCCNWV